MVVEKECQDSVCYWSMCQPQIEVSCSVCMYEYSYIGLEHVDLRGRRRRRNVWCFVSETRNWCHLESKWLLLLRVSKTHNLWRSVVPRFIQFAHARVGKGLDATAASVHQHSVQLADSAIAFLSRTRVLDQCHVCKFKCLWESDLGDSIWNIGRNVHVDLWWNRWGTMSIAFVLFNTTFRRSTCIKSDWIRFNKRWKTNWRDERA